MKIENSTSYEAIAIPLPGPDGQPTLTVIVKGTFDLVPNGALVPAKQQMPILFGDEPNDPAAGGSIRFESDAVLSKPRADLFLAATAHAPGGVPVRTMDVSVRVGRLEKRLRVFGDRHWRCLGRWSPAMKSSPEPFSSMPIVYEKAFGGIDTKGGGYCRENPVGVGYVEKKRRKALNRAPLPNIENPAHLIRRWKDRPFPAGFGCFGRAWAPRIDWMGTYDEAWMKQRAPLPPLDADPRYQNAAHPELQAEEYFKGDESVELVNLTDDGYLNSQLPALGIACTVNKAYDLHFGPSGPEMPESKAFPRAHPFAEPVAMHLDTICLIPDEKTAYLVWRGTCSLRDLTALEVKTVEIAETSIV